MTQDAMLPKTILRPLHWSALGLLLFLIVLVVWAFLAPLATSLQVTGTLVSSRPSYEIQHAFGGPVLWVGVREQQEVRRGDPLFRIDVTTQREALAEVTLQIEALQAEIDVITGLHAGSSKPGDHDPDAPISARYAALYETVDLRQEILLDQSVSAREQVQAGRAEAQLIEKRIALLFDLKDKQQQLYEKGLARDADVDGLEGQILTLSADLEQLRASNTSLRSAATQAKAEAAVMRAEFEAQLMTTQQQNRLQLSRLRAERSALKAQLAVAEITSPVDGHVHALHFDSAYSYAPRGQTLAVIAQSLDSPMVRLTVSPTDIDQIHVGMQGNLVIPSLPQRDMPQLLIEIVTISPEAEKDDAGVVLGYTATARIAEDSLEDAKRLLDARFRLVTDMPVTATMTGRNLTVAEYLLNPITKVFSAGFQE